MVARQKRLMLLLGVLLTFQAGLYLLLYVDGVRAGDRFGGDFICFWQAAVRDGVVVSFSVNGEG